VSTGRRSPPSPEGALKATVDATAARSGTAVTVRASSRVIRDPATNSTRSHQWEPMSAKARDGPPRAASTRQLTSSGVSSQSCW
jgi:hypothetical protein